MRQERVLASRSIISHLPAVRRFLREVWAIAVSSLRHNSAPLGSGSVRILFGAAIPSRRNQEKGQS
jgi:hypothetical protein